MISDEEAIRRVNQMIDRAAFQLSDKEAEIRLNRMIEREKTGISDEKALQIAFGTVKAQSIDEAVKRLSNKFKGVRHGQKR